MTSQVSIPEPVTIVDDYTRFLSENVDIFCCPRCRAPFCFEGDKFTCTGCKQVIEKFDNIPLMFCPNDWESSKKDVTGPTKEFYEDITFPNYDDFDDAAALLEKARKGVFARLLDDQLPAGIRVLECGCGTGQLTSFLSMAGRTVIGTDMSVNSLRLGQQFKERNELKRAFFLQMNLFRPAFKDESFDLVISNGVLHHTSDPFLGFQTIAKLVKKGRYILVGLYHTYGRLITDLRRQIFRVTGDRFTCLDPNLRKVSGSTGKKRAWFMDQYKHPHESKHTLSEVTEWLTKAGFSFVRSYPSSVPFKPFSSKEGLFTPEPAGNWLDHLITSLEMIFKGSKEGGLFIVIAKRE